LHFKLVFSLGFIGIYTMAAHVVEELARDLFQSFLSQLHGIVLELPEWHKLNNVCTHVLLVFAGV